MLSPHECLIFHIFYEFTEQAQAPTKVIVGLNIYPSLLWKNSVYSYSFLF